MEAFYLALFAGIAGSVAVLELAKAPEAHAGSPDFTWLRRNFVTVYALMMGAAPRFRLGTQALGSKQCVLSHCQTEILVLRMPVTCNPSCIWVAWTGV